MAGTLSRRAFLKTTAAGIVLAGMPGWAEGEEHSWPIPRRKLGKTGLMVSILGFGGGAGVGVLKDVELADQLLNEAIDSGINFFDTAPTYGRGHGETLFGRVLGPRRKEVLIATKVERPRNRDVTLRCIEGSLKRLQTDHVDILHIHGLGPADDIAAFGRPDGMYTALQELREQKVTRFIGVTSHSASLLRKAVDAYEFDAVMMPLNASRTGGFETELLPYLLEKKIGVIGMKMAARGNLIGEGQGKADAQSLLRYSLSLPVPTTVVGMESLSVLRANVQTARNFQPMTQEEKNSVIARTAGSPRRLAYLNPGYQDGIA